MDKFKGVESDNYNTLILQIRGLLVTLKINLFEKNEGNLNARLKKLMTELEYGSQATLDLIEKPRVLAITNVFI